MKKKIRGKFLVFGLVAFFFVCEFESFSNGDAWYFFLDFKFPVFPRHFSFMFSLSLNHFTLKLKTWKFMCWWHNKNKKEWGKCVEEFWHWFIKIKSFMKKIALNLQSKSKISWKSFRLFHRLIFSHSTSK